MFIVLAIIFALHDPAPWEVDVQSSALDGRQHYVASRASENTVASPGGPKTGRLTFGCILEARHLIIDYPQSTSLDTIEVTWRFDDGEIRRDRARVVGRTGTTFMIEARPENKIFEDLSASSRLVVRVGSGQDLTFDVGGASEHVEAASQMCGQTDDSRAIRPVSPSTRSFGESLSSGN